MIVGRGVMGVMAWIGALIVLGLILTHSKEFSTVENATFTGIGATIRDLQMLNKSGTHG